MRIRIHPLILYLAPISIVLALVLLFPLLYSFYLSFSEITPNLRVEPRGIGNFVNVIESEKVWRSLSNSALYTVVSVTGQLILGMGCALLLNEKIPFRRWVRLTMLLPWAIPTVVSTLTWRWMLDLQYGLVNDWLYRLGLIQEFRSWIGNPATALASAMAVNIWRGFPFIMIMLLAGMQGIQDIHYDAAKVDGASTIQRFLYVTLPSLKYTIAVATLISAIWAFKDFTIVYLLTHGGPAGSSEVVVTLVYKMFFKFSRFGDAAALGVIVFIILIVFAGVYVHLVAGEGEQEQK